MLVWVTTSPPDPLEPPEPEPEPPEPEPPEPEPEPPEPPGTVEPPEPSEPLGTPPPEPDGPEGCGTSPPWSPVGPLGAGETGSTEFPDDDPPCVRINMDCRRPTGAEDDEGIVRAVEPLRRFTEFDDGVALGAGDGEAGFCRTERRRSDELVERAFVLDDVTVVVIRRRETLGVTMRVLLFDRGAMGVTTRRTPPEPLATVGDRRSDCNVDSACDGSSATWAIDTACPEASETIAAQSHARCGRCG
ncbi:MAG: hypothetical protein SFY69_10555 [Planctomycetota bacterium]|nr:hypothetical protein [Planctomycetota bacterium]